MPPTDASTEALVGVITTLQAELSTQRKERAREREPEVVKQARALCAIAALSFQGFLGVEPHEIDGETVPAWHLMASGSRCILTTWEGCTVLINADDQAVLARMDA